jgi:hypothetical protein
MATIKNEVNLLENMIFLFETSLLFPTTSMPGMRKEMARSGSSGKLITLPTAQLALAFLLG